jgi:hypothetical protein
MFNFAGRSNCIVEACPGPKRLSPLPLGVVGLLARSYRQVDVVPQVILVPNFASRFAGDRARMGAQAERGDSHDARRLVAQDRHDAQRGEIDG